MNSFKEETVLLESLGSLPRTAARSRRDQSWFPKRIVRWLARLNCLFFWTVFLPTLLAGIYFGLIASDVYISESSFVLKSAQVEQMGGMTAGSLLKLASGNASSDTYNVMEFM